MLLKKNQHRVSQHHSENYELTKLNLIEIGDFSG